MKRSSLRRGTGCRLSALLAALLATAASAEPATPGEALSPIATADLPRHEGQVTLITLRDSVVQTVRDLSRATDVRQALALPER